MSIFSRLFKKSRRSEDQWAKRPNDSTDKCVSDETQMMSIESERSSLSAVDIDHMSTTNDERTGPRVIEVKIPWGKPRSEMSADELNAIREYDRKWYANNRAKKTKSIEDWALDITGATSNV